MCDVTEFHVLRKMPKKKKKKRKRPKIIFHIPRIHLFVFVESEKDLIHLYRN